MGKKILRFFTACVIGVGLGWAHAFYIGPLLKELIR